LVAHAAAMAGVVAFVFLPMAWEQWIANPPDFARADAWTRSEWSVPSPRAGLELLWAVAWYGQRYVTRFWLGADAATAAMLSAVFAAILCAAAVGLVSVWRRDASRRRLVAWLAAFALLHAMFLCAIRDAMPPWMVYALWLPLAALLALGMAAYRRRTAGRMAVSMLLAVAVGWTFAVYAALASGTTQFLNIAPSPGKRGFMDVRDYEETVTTFRISRVPFRELYALGAELCEPVTLYGHYAYQVDYTYAVSAAQACGTTRQVRFGGPLEAGRRAWVGLHRDAWAALDARPPRWLSTLGIAPVAAVWHSPVPLGPVLPTLSNFPRQLDAGGVRDFTVEGEAPPGHAVLVSHRASRYLPFDVIAARADGRPVQPVYRDMTSALFAPGAGPGDTVRWQLEVRAHPDYVDVLPLAAPE
jgi:hypothetical protein